MFVDILKIVLPALLVFLAGYLALFTMLKNERERRKAEMLFNTSKITVPLRLQAYERLTLFLERISPESILMRVNKPHMSCADLHSALLGNIRAEWEHNLSQQLYVSKAAWDLVRNAKENIIKIINLSAEHIEPEEKAIVLSQKIFDIMVNLDTNPVAIATSFLKNEVRDILQ